MQSFSNNIEVSHAQRNLLNIITKQTILSTISALSTQTWLIYYAPLAVIWAYGNESDRVLYSLHITSEFIVVIDCCVNAMCLLLAFAFAKPYYICLCRSYHQCCLRNCVKRTKRKIARDLSMQEIDLSSYRRM